MRTPNLRPKRLVRAAASGVVATAPMTALMEYGYRRLPRSERYPLPPRLIVDETGRRTGLGVGVSNAARTLVTIAGHFGYGGATGALYGLTGRGSVPASIPRGAAFGLGVWAVSYLGWLPAVGLLSSATRHPVRRTGLMMAAHVVWGVATALLTERPEPRRRRRWRLT